MYLDPPFPTFPALILSCEENKVRPPEDRYIFSSGMIQAIYYGAVAAFAGKTFTNLNG